MLKAVLGLLRRRPLLIQSAEMQTIEERIAAAEARIEREDRIYTERLRDRKLQDQRRG